MSPRIEARRGRELTTAIEAACTKTAKNDFLSGSFGTTNQSIDVIGKMCLNKIVISRHVHR